MNLPDEEGWPSDEEDENGWLSDEEEILPSDDSQFAFEDEPEKVDEEIANQPKGKFKPKGDTRFQAKDYENWRNEEREAEDPVCPKCDNFPLVLNDEKELLNLGFTMKPSAENSEIDIMYAPLGICQGPCTKDPSPPSTPFGTPLVMPNENEEMLEQRRLKESLLDEDDDDVMIPFDNIGGDGQIVLPFHGNEWEIRMQIKSRYSGSHLQNLNPPYTNATKDLIGLSAFEGKHQATTPDEARKQASSSKDPLDWFHNLGPDLIELERIMNRTEGSTPIIKERLLIVAFLHKSAHFKHIESLWVFATRLGLGSRQVARAFSRWPSQQPRFAQIHLENLRLQPTKESLESMLDACQQTGKFKLDDDVEGFIIEEANNLLEKMSDSEHGGINVLQSLIQKCSNSDEFTLAGEALPAVGLMESLILKRVIEKAKGYDLKNGLADDILETLFPRPQGGERFWETTLSVQARNLFNNWDRIIDKFVD